MYEDLKQIAQLRFGKEMEAIASQTRANLQQEKARFAATAGAGIRSGQHDASLGRLRIEGIEAMARAYFRIWVDLIKQRNGHIARSDIDFVAQTVEQFVNSQRGHLRTAFAEHGGAVVPSLVEQANIRTHAVCASVRRDLEIMVREHEAFPPKSEVSMKQIPKKRFSAGRRVLVGMGMQPATVQSVADAPSTLGEYVHEVLLEGGKGMRRVLGSELQPVPELDEDLRGHRPSIHIENSNVANLNVGSQIGTITANLQAISKGGDTQQQFAFAIEQLTQAIVADAALAPNQKQEVVEAITTISQEATKKPEERSKVTLKALVTWLPTAISAANGLVTLWENVGPTIKGYLGI